MSKLYYDIELGEEHVKEPYEMIAANIPHFRQIKKWLPKQFEECHLEKAFDEILKDKITSCKMTLHQKRQNGNTISYARITIEFIPGFRVTKKYRDACFAFMDIQMVDGIGECFDRQVIPNTNGWRLAL